MTQVDIELMTKPILFVCKSCHPDEERPENQPADGAQLLDRLNRLSAEQFPLNELEIQPVGCLWTCDHPCSVAFCAPNKATYLFTNVPATAATALLQFGALYRTSKDGDIPWKQFPEVLQSTSVAKIPAV